MIVELAVDHLAGGPDDGAGATLVDQAELAVGFRRRKFDHPERANDRQRHPVLADAKILAGTLGLRAPVAVRGNIDRAEAIGLGSRRTGFRRCRGSSHEYVHCPTLASRAVRRGSERHAGLDHRADILRYHFLRKRSSRTTSAPSLGLPG